MLTPRPVFQNRRRLSAFATLGLSALLLVGCGGGDDEDPTEAPAAQATTAPVQSPTRAATSPTEPAGAAARATPVRSVATPAAGVGADEATPVASPVASPVR